MNPLLVQVQNNHQYRQAAHVHPGPGNDLVFPRSAQGPFAPNDRLDISSCLSDWSVRRAAGNWHAAERAGWDGLP